MVILLMATRRSLGLPLTIVAMVFLGYTFGGAYMPELISHRGASLSRTMSHQWLTTEGVFGVAIGVSTSFVFLYVLFGSMQEKAGAGAYFIKVAFSLLGHMRAGPQRQRWWPPASAASSRAPPSPTWSPRAPSPSPS
jgi:TRAP-type uncharacterized transport system fused permease subunit